MLCHLSGVIHMAIINIKMHLSFSVSVLEECSKEKKSFVPWLVISHVLIKLKENTYKTYTFWKKANIDEPVSYSSCMKKVYISMEVMATCCF